MQTRMRAPVLLMRVHMRVVLHKSSEKITGRKKCFFFGRPMRAAKMLA
jgi:hypothetical protein